MRLKDNFKVQEIQNITYECVRRETLRATENTLTLNTSQNSSNASEARSALFHQLGIEVVAFV